MPKKYEWTRFWCPRDKTFLVSPEGLLYDPASDNGKLLSPDLGSLSSFSSHSCLVLLGEPGSGKSTEFGLEFDRQLAESSIRGDACLRFDLNMYQTDSLLISDVFESDEVKRWKSGNHHLFLFLDSLDEARLEIRTVANLISDRLTKLAAHAPRLSLRIACRTAEWPHSLEHSLIAVWEETLSVQFLELAPLRESDVRLAAKCEGVNCDEFISEVSKAEAYAFSANPISLKFLIQQFSRSRALPNDKAQLFESGCSCLCEEFSVSRQETQRTGQLSPRERLFLAGKIAALSELSGCNTLCVGNSTDAGPGEVTVTQLSGGVEDIEGKKIYVTESAVREVISTTLFSGRGRERLGFAHKTYAEFLTSYYLKQHKLDVTQLRTVLFHVDGERVIPQLAETAAWVATNSSETFEEIFSSDPQVLLRSDVPSDDSSKERIVERLLQGFKSGELDDSDSAIRSGYRKLRHNRLAAQLSPELADKNNSYIVRRFVADCAEECGTTELLGSLLTIALDETDEMRVRIQVAHAVKRLGDQSSFEKLRPLALAQKENDPDDELKGIALSCLRAVNLISGAELFRSLHRPQRKSFLGSYRYFLAYELPLRIENEELVPALHWCSVQPRQNAGLDEFEDVEKVVVDRSFQCLDRNEVKEAFADYLESRLNRHDKIPSKQESLDSLKASNRRKLILAVVSRVSDVNKMFIECTGLIRSEDFDWLLEMTRAGNPLIERRKYARLVLRQYSWSGAHHLEKVLEEYQNNECIREEFANVLSPIKLGSEKAIQLRKQYEEHIRLEKERERLKKNTLLEPPPHQRVAECLRRFEQGETDAWWHLIQELQLEATSTHYKYEFEDDLTVFPGWKVAQPELRIRLIRAAREYLFKWKPDYSKIRRNSQPYTNLAAYRALLLLQTEDPPAVDALTAREWEKLAPAIVNFPISSGMGTESESRHRDAVSLAYHAAPQRVMWALFKLIDQDNVTNQHGLHLLRCFESCLDRKLGLRLLAKARESSLCPQSIADLVSCAFKACPEEAEAMARAKLLGSLSQSKSRRSFLANKPSRILRTKKMKRLKSRTRPSKVAVSSKKQCAQLAKHLAGIIWLNSSARWQLLEPIFRRDESFLKSAVELIAQDCRQSRKSPEALSEEALADLFILLSRAFPHRTDPNSDGAHFVGPRESVANFRESVLKALQSAGTVQAVQHLRRIESAFPDLEYIAWIRRDAIRTMLRASWDAPSISELQRLFAAKGNRLIRSTPDLVDVVIESLNRLQSRLTGETPAARDIWDRNKNGKQELWAPVDENAFSDYVARFLKSDLESLGIISLREVEIRRGYARPGERTDLYVGTKIDGEGGNDSKVVRLIVEVKGCWHQELTTAMETQLKERYLHENDCEAGIYLVGWFLCDSWRSDDNRKANTPSWSLAEARHRFHKQASEISVDGARIRSVVLDTHLR